MTYLKDSKKMKALGLRLPKVDIKTVSGISSSLEDLSMLSEVKGNFVYPADILFISRKTGYSVLEIVQRLSNFSALGLTLPEIDVHGLEKTSASEEDCRVLSLDLDGLKAVQSKRISIFHLIKVSQYYDEPIADSRNRLSALSYLGIRVPSSNIDSIEDLNLSPEDLITLPSNLYEGAPWPKDIRIAEHLIKISRELNETYEQVYGRLKRFKIVGLDIPNIDIALLRELTDINENNTALSPHISPFSVKFVRGRVHPSHILASSLILQESVLDTFARFEKFKDLLKLTLPPSNPELWSPFKP